MCVKKKVIHYNLKGIYLVIQSQIHTISKELIVPQSIDEEDFKELIEIIKHAKNHE